jgi:hypothetical protein
MYRDHNNASSNGALGERCEVIMIADWKCKDGMVRNRSPENCQEQFLLV